MNSEGACCTGLTRAMDLAQDKGASTWPKSITFEEQTDSHLTNGCSGSDWEPSKYQGVPIVITLPMSIPH